MPCRPALASIATYSLSLGLLATAASADFIGAVLVPYEVTAEEFGGATVTVYVQDLYLVSDDPADTLLNIYNCNLPPDAQTSFFQSFTGTGWQPTNLGGPFDTEAVRYADSFVTIGGFPFGEAFPPQDPGAGAGSGLDPNFGGNNADYPGVDAGWYNGSPSSLNGAVGDTIAGLGVLCGRFASLEFVSLEGMTMEMTWNQGLGTPGSQAVVTATFDGITDCNANGVPDLNELLTGEASDCNANFIPDDCETIVNSSASMDGIPASARRLTLDTADLPAPTGDIVNIATTARGEFASSAEFLTVTLDGSLVGYAFTRGAGDCTNLAQSFEISAEAFIEAGLDGSRVIEVYASPAVDPTYCPSSEVSVTVSFLSEGDDCNLNGAWDACDIANGVSADADSDGVPDECQPDCDGDGVPDVWAVAQGIVPDCNNNGSPDACDIADGVSNDVDSNGVPDECKPDCNGNGLPDAYEIATGMVADCNDNGRPDSCDIDKIGEADCDADGVLDICAVADGLVPDCNENEIPDSCDIASGASTDVDGDTVPDDCQPDCDGDGLPDTWELATGLATDCNANTVPDNCDIADGIDEDSNGNGLPDQCDLARGDVDLDGCVGPADLGFLLALWGFDNPPVGDLNGDALIDAADLGILLGNWDGVCP